MGCHSVSHRLFHEKNIVFLPSLLICIKQNEPGWGEDGCREKVHLTGSREMPLANYGWLHDFSWVSPTKHFALLKLWITLSSDFLFLRKGDRHSLGTEGAAKVQHQSEESCEVRCETGPGSWALGLWSVGWEEKQRWREGGKHTRKRMGLRRAWERRIRWPVSDQKMSLCLCWEYLPHNTDRFVFPLKMQNLANKVSLSVACQWTSRVTNRWLVLRFQIIPEALFRFWPFHTHVQRSLFLRWSTRPSNCLLHLFNVALLSLWQDCGNQK